MSTKEEILEKLKQADGYVSGQQLCQGLGISRTAVWKAVGKLREEGYPIEAVTNRGYRLREVAGADLLNRERLEACMRTDWAGRPVLYKKETLTTQQDAVQLSDQGAPEGTLVVTSMQTGGRGRRGRTWISPPDVNIYMSILLRPRIRPETAPMVTLVMALAVYRASLDLPVQEGRFCRFGIKWPNDIVASVDGGPYRKLAGILTEMRLEEREIRDIVIGTGLNINQTEFPEEIRETASSYRLVTGRSVNRASFTAAIWKYFEEDYSLFLRARSLAPVREAYEEGLVNKGRTVRVLDPAGPFTGTAGGITDTGEMIVTPRTGGPDRIISSGEVSVRGVEGYV